MLKSLVRNNKKVLINVKVTPDEERRIRANAKRFAKGNLSAWLRWASMKHRPSPSELT